MERSGIPIRWAGIGYGPENRTHARLTDRGRARGLQLRSVRQRDAALLEYYSSLSKEADSLDQFHTSPLPMEAILMYGLR